MVVSDPTLMTKLIRDYLNRHECRCLLIVLASSPLDEKECRVVFSRYGAIRKIKLTPNNGAAFIDFDCEHTPLLVARCFALRQTYPKLSFPKGMELLLPGCSVNNFLFLESLPKVLSTDELQKHFVTFTGGHDFAIHRPELSSRAVVQLDSVEASAYHKHQKRLTSMMVNGKVLQFNSIPQLEQLINDKSIFDQSGCQFCKVTQIRELLGLEKQEAPVDQTTGNDCSVVRALPPSFSSTMASQEDQLRTVLVMNKVAPTAPSKQLVDYQKDFESKWKVPSQKVPNSRPKDPRTRNIPSILSLPKISPTFGGGCVPSSPPSKNREKGVNRVSKAPPPDPIHHPSDWRSAGLNWKAFGIEETRSSVSRESKSSEKIARVTARVEPVRKKERDKSTPNGLEQAVDGETLKSFADENTDKSRSSERFDWKTALAAPEFVPMGKANAVIKKEEVVEIREETTSENVIISEDKEKIEEVDSDDQRSGEEERWKSAGHYHVRSLNESHATKEVKEMEGEGSIRCSSRASVTDQYLDSITRKYHIEDSMEGSVPKAEIVPLPSALSASSSERGIEREGKTTVDAIAHQKGPRSVSFAPVVESPPKKTKSFFGILKMPPVGK